jgi:hypothetical protein
MKKFLSTLAVIALFSAGLPAEAAEPGSGIANAKITQFDPQNGIVSARDIATGKTFQFKVNDLKLVKQLKVGQGVRADLTTGQVTIQGVKGRYKMVSASGGKGASPEAVLGGELRDCVGETLKETQDKCKRCPVIKSYVPCITCSKEGYGRSAGGLCFTWVCDCSARTPGKSGDIPKVQPNPQLPTNP